MSSGLRSSNPKTPKPQNPVAVKYNLIYVFLLFQLFDMMPLIQFQIQCLAYIHKGCHKDPPCLVPLRDLLRLLRFEDLNPEDMEFLLQIPALDKAELQRQFLMLPPLL